MKVHGKSNIKVEMESVYCAVRTDSLTPSDPPVPDAFLYLKPFPIQYFCHPHTPQHLFILGGKEVGVVTCNYLTVLKEKNRNRRSTTCAICWLKSVLHEEKRREQENHNVGLRPTL
jgi:hypothetical protein